MAHGVHRSRNPLCEVAHSLEAVRWRELFAENLTQNIDFLDVVLPPNSANQPTASLRGDKSLEDESAAMDEDMEPEE